MSAGTFFTGIDKSVVQYERRPVVLTRLDLEGQTRRAVVDVAVGNQALVGHHARAGFGGARPVCFKTLDGYAVLALVGIQLEGAVGGEKASKSAIRRYDH